MPKPKKFGIQHVIELSITLAVITVTVFYSPRATQAQTSSDFEFLSTMGLPWRCGDEEPRYVTKDWNDHWETSPPTAVGAAVDFNRGGEADYDKDVLAPFAGTVITRDTGSTEYGKLVIIDAGNGWSVYLAHLKNFMVDNGSFVNKGQVVGKSNDTGSSEGSHIHLELRWNDGRPDSNWFNADDDNNFLFSHPTEDFRSPEMPFYSNNCGPGPTTILHGNHWYEGPRTYFFGSGTFNVPQWFNDQASSLSLEPETVKIVATLYEHGTFDPRWPEGRITFGANEPDFADDQFNNGEGVNDKISSLHVSIGDLNSDGDVDIFDYTKMIQNFGRTECGNVADINGDCDVDILDYSILVRNFGWSAVQGHQQLENHVRALEIGPSIFFSPLEMIVTSADTDQTYEIFMATNDFEVAAAVIEISFDPQALQITAIEPGESLPVLLQSDVKTNSTKITVGCRVTAPFNGIGKVAKITFDAGSKPTRAVISFTANTQVAAIGYADDVLGTTTDGTVIITSRVYLPMVSKTRSP